MKAYEVNFDGLVGPTHNYAGLSFGNIASARHAQGISNPKAAAQQGLAKMQKMAELGVVQAVLPPQERPDVATLRRIGFTGSDHAVIAKASRQEPALFAACCSASSMWTANAATVAPSADTADRRVHFTPANLVSKFHRALEVPTTARIFQAIFTDPHYFVHHAPLPAGEQFSDEGAANHTRLCRTYGESGLHVFVYGRSASTAGILPQRFPARHTLEAARAVARLHQLDPKRVVFAQQNPEVIDVGVFHNDVIAVGNETVLFYHKEAFLNANNVVNEIQTQFAPDELHLIEVPGERVTVAEAVTTYLFNSQLLTLPDGTMAIVVPTECEENANVKEYLNEVVAARNPIAQVHYVELRESMKNGGGPACLRQRVVLTDDELKQVNRSVFLEKKLFERLNDWIERYYRDRLKADDLADPQLLDESRTALDELTGMLHLGSVYPFQR